MGSKTIKCRGGYPNSFKCNRRVTATCIICNFEMCERHTVEGLRKLALPNRVLIGWVCADCYHTPAKAYQHCEVLQSDDPILRIGKPKKQFKLDECITVQKIMEALCDR